MTITRVGTDRIAAASTAEGKKSDRTTGGNVASAKSVGKTIAERAKEKGITQVVFDRGGYLYHTGASPAQFVTPLLPEGARNEFTIGAGVALNPHWHADLAYQYIRQQDRRGTVNIAQGNTGLYQFSAHLFGAGVSVSF